MLKKSFCDFLFKAQQRRLTVVNPVEQNCYIVETDITVEKTVNKYETANALIKWMGLQPIHFNRQNSTLMEMAAEGEHG